MRKHPLFKEMLRAYALCKRPVLEDIPALEASEEVLFKEFAEEDHALLRQAEEQDEHDDALAQYPEDEVPGEEMTAFLEETIATLRAHRAEIEALIMVSICFSVSDACACYQSH